MPHIGAKIRTFAKMKLAVDLSRLEVGFWSELPRRDFLGVWCWDFARAIAWPT